ncbi:MAG: Spy/CpxP family protein refolding chaperone [Bacteroides sp.]|nr:Spy/CpxP family protein refolding chaperone [Bacteroides sp.]
MKKTVLSISLLLASIIGFSASAQTATDNNKGKSNTECTAGCTKKDAPKYNPFAGLNLTEKQQSELQALKPSKCDKQQSQCTSGQNKDKSKDMTKEKKAALRKQHAEKRIQNRRDYLAKVKTILTPEQYVQFLENTYVDQAPKAPAQGKMAKNKDGRKHGKYHAMRGDFNRGNK